VGGDPAIVIASSDPQRTGLSLQNLDPVANLFYAFGRLADATSRFLTPGMTLLRTSTPRPIASRYCARERIGRARNGNTFSLIDS